MATKQYRVVKPSFVNNIFYEAGTIVDYDGEVSDNLLSLEKEQAAAAKSAPAEEPLA